MAYLPDWADLAIRPSKQGVSGTTPYGHSALDSECEKVATAAQFTRNDTFNKSSFAVAQLVAGGEIDEATARQRLAAAAVAVGLEKREIDSTLASAFAAGSTNPRKASRDDWVDGTSRAKAAKRWYDCRSISARELNEMEFPPVKYVVPGYIAEGLTLLAGKPKLGKSWLAMDIALNVADGGVCLGDVECEAGDVLYLALEDNRRRLQSRIRKLWTRAQPIPNRLHLATEWPRADKGGIDGVRQWIANRPGARLVIVDVLAMFKPTAKGREQTQYDADFAAIKGLQSLALETGVAIVVVHHTRKGGGDADPFEKVSGTLGLSGAADTTLILDRDGNGCTLYGRGRDIEEIETAVQFNKETCRWTALGNATDIRRTDERNVILEALADNKDDMSPAELADATGMTSNNLRQLLFKMAKAGDVVKAARGRYRHPNHTPDNNDNNDNDRGRRH